MSTWKPMWVMKEEWATFVSRIVVIICTLVLLLSDLYVFIKPRKSSSRLENYIEIQEMYETYLVNWKGIPKQKFESQPLIRQSDSCDSQDWIQISLVYSLRSNGKTEDISRFGN